MNMHVLVLIACLSLTSAAGLDLEFNCTGLPNGLAWWGCRSYINCINGQHDQRVCDPGEAYDQNSKSCVQEDQAAFPCNRQADCTSLEATVHRIPEMEVNGDFPSCTFYYTCNYGLFIGHQMCPEGLVYSENDQKCLLPELAPQPCGTLDVNN